MKWVTQIKVKLIPKNKLIKQLWARISDLELLLYLGRTAESDAYLKSVWSLTEKLIKN